jgi:tRNA uridine 5-carboxymethylaminomethyl modification enzyme
MKLGAALTQDRLPIDLIRLGLQIRDDGLRRPLSEWLRFPEVKLAGLAPWLGERTVNSELAEEIHEDCIYAPYLARQETELRQLRAGESLPLGDDFPYADVPGLSREMVERLERAQPDTLAAAGRVAGITPAALASLLVRARRRVTA